uniref:phage tail-collar fiber domain-containing protein n=1 Tax=Megasphaera sp. TaxID=2023260 RepID=UPI003079B37E
MANWKQVTLTNAGRELAAAVTAGQLKLNITEIWFGSGTPANLETATDLAAKKIKADIVSIKQQDMECLIAFRVSNEGQASAVVLSEMGFYAKGTSGSNILFSVTTDDQPATLPAQGSGPVYRQTMTMAFGYSNAENVEIDSTIIDGTPAEDVAAMIQEHDASSSAHQDIREAIETAVDNHNTDAEAHKDFVGATAAEAGARGMVPVPPAGAQNKVLTGGEIWTLIEELTVALGNIEKPQADTAALKTLLGWIVYMIQSITGQNNWKTLPAASIAAILTNLQGNLAVNWDGNKFTVPALGISGLMAQNGYVNFGKLVGGLIVQWGMQGGGNNWDVYYPIT